MNEHREVITHYRLASTGDCVCGQSIINDFEWVQHMKTAAPVPQSGGEALTQNYLYPEWPGILAETIRAIIESKIHPQSLKDAEFNLACYDEQVRKFGPLHSVAAPTSDRGAGTGEAVLVGKMRQFAEECLRRHKINPEYSNEIMHTEDTYHDLLKLCDLAAPTQLVEQRELREGVALLVGTQVAAAVNECADMHGIGPNFPRTWLDTNMDFNELAKALNKRLAVAPQPKEAELRELVASWRKQANYSMQTSQDREAHVAAAAELVCADVLEAALATRPAQDEKE